MFLIAGFSLSYFYPQFLNALLIANLAFCLFIYFLRFKFLPDAKSFQSLFLINGCSKRSDPFVSIHAPIHRKDAPFALETLAALNAIEYKSAEIVVLICDPDVEHVKKIRKFCRQRNKQAMGAKFKVRLAPKLNSHTARALNKCLELSSPKSDFILHSHCGCRPQAHILRKTVHLLRHKNADYVQLPRTFTRRVSGGDYLKMENDHFYQTYMRTTASANAVILQEGPCLMRKASLLHIGGWKDDGAPAEAATSLELVKAGFKGIYDHSLCGEAAMAKDLGGLRNQRRIQALGGAQTLFSLSIRDLKNMGKRKAAAVLVQLSAWQEFMFLPLLYFILHGLDPFTDYTLMPNQAGASALAGTTILLSLYLKLSLLHQKLNSLYPSKVIFKIYFIHLGLGFEANFGWVKSLAGIGDEKTPEAQGANSLVRSRLSSAVPHLTLTLIAAWMSFALYSRGENVAVVTPFFTGALMMTGALAIHLELLKGSREGQK